MIFIDMHCLYVETFQYITRGRILPLPVPSGFAASPSLEASTSPTLPDWAFAPLPWSTGPTFRAHPASRRFDLRPWKRRGGPPGSVVPLKCWWRRQESNPRCFELDQSVTVRCWLNAVIFSKNSNCSVAGILVVGKDPPWQIVTQDAAVS